MKIIIKMEIFMKVRPGIVLLCTNLILIMLFIFCAPPMKPDFPPRLGNDKNLKIEGTPELGEKIILYIIATSDNPLTYKWYKNNAVIEGAENDSLVIDPLMIGHEGEYKCKVIAASASVTSNTYILKIIRENYDTLIDNNGIIFCSGKPQINKQFFMYIRPRNNLAIDCQWYKNDEIIDGETNDTLRFKALSDFDQGNYFCKAKYYSRIEKSMSYALEFGNNQAVNTSPLWIGSEAVTIVNDTINVSLDLNTPYTLILSDVCLDPQSDEISYTLHSDDLEGDRIEGTTYTFKPSALFTGTATVAIDAKDPEGLLSTLYIIFASRSPETDTDPPKIFITNFQSDTFVINRDEVRLECLVTDISSIQSFTCTSTNSKVVTSVEKKSDTSFTCIINGFPSKAQTTLILTAIDKADKPNLQQDTLLITYDPAMIDDVKPSITLVNPKMSGERLLVDHITVQIRCTDNSGIASVTCERGSNAVPVTAGVNSIYSAEITGLIPGKSETITFTAWDKSTHSNKAILSVDFVYGEKPIITKSNGLQDQRLEKGRTLSLGIEASGIPDPSFQWYHNNVKITGATNETYKKSNITEDDVGTYYVIVANDVGEVISSTIKLTLVYSVSFDAMYGTTDMPSDSKLYAEGDIVTLPATEPNRDGYIFRGWSINKKGNVEYKPSGIYTMGTDNVIFYAVWKLKPPNIVNIIGDTILMENSDQQFTVEATGDSLTFQWLKDGRDIIYATEKNFSLSNVQLSDSGTYTCIVHNSSGPYTSSYVNVHVVLPAASVATHLGYNTLILTEKGALWGRGINNFGQLGDGSLEDRKQFVQIITEGVIAIWTATNGGYSLVLKDDFTLWSFGHNDEKQMGIHIEIVDVPTQIASNVKQAAGGRDHTLILKHDGSVWVTGSGSWGQLGDGSGKDRSTFTKLISDGVKSIAAGYFTSLILKEDGSVWGCGLNTRGQLGIGKGLDSSSTLVKIISSGFKSIAAGLWHSIFLRDDGSLWMTGTFEYEYQKFTDTLYNPTKIVENGVTSFSSGLDHVIFRKNDGSFWVFGANRYGQFTTGRRPVYSIEPIQILKDWDVEQVIATGSNTAIINREGALWMCGEYTSEKNHITNIVDEPTRVIIP